MYFTNLEGTILVEGKNKLEALKKIKSLIYFKGVEPYGINFHGESKTFLKKANVYRRKTHFVLDLGVINEVTKEEKIVKFDLNFNYIKEFRF